MLRILSWSSGLGCDKMHGPELNMFVPQEQSSAVASLALSSIKRKRSPSFDSPADSVFVPSQAVASINQGNRQLCQAATNEAQQVAHVKQETFQPLELPAHIDATLSHRVDGVQSPQLVPSERPEARMQSMRQTIASQMSLEILLKHKELRLIDQELAKCQVALEQLRRCSEIPYPGTQQPSWLVSEGKGPAIRKLGDSYPAESPAPWGVTDGPYSRHYARWLLPDRRFDGGEPEPLSAHTSGPTPTSGRSTRGHYVDVLGGKCIKSRTHRGSQLQSLPAGYGQPKEKATGPMILKRKSDGAMVKLVCPDCGRHDFGSAQGFINHCRIGHGRSFASHDAAAEACGEPVEYNDNGTVKGIEPVITPSASNVHPLVRSAKLFPPPVCAAITARDFSTPSSKQLRDPAISQLTPDFQASIQAPHLSALIKNKGLGLNLHGLVADAKTKVDLSEPEMDEDDTDLDSPLPTGTGRHPQVAGNKQPVKSSMSKAPSILMNSRMRLSDSSHDIAERPSLSTNDPRHNSFQVPLASPTNDSTQAPSLIDDDEELDPQSPVSNDELDENDVDFEVQDDEQGERAVRLGDDLSQAARTCNPTARGPARSCNSHISRAIASNEADEQRVTFVSPSPAPEGSDRKRRKVKE